MTEVWPWLVVAGLGAFHGLNPAIGWLFAVALGMHRQSQTVVLQSLLPIAAGHALAVVIVALAFVYFGSVIDQKLVQRICGVVLVAWALYHALYGHRHRVRVGMQTGMWGLALWSFLMASAHGAGLMLIPALVPLCLAATPAKELTAGGSMLTALAAVGVHTAAMLAVTGTIAIIVYRWVGLAFLRRGWLNVDLLWTAALVVAGLFLII
ncbi:MAG: hypothetical protein V3V97_13275 [Hyphomicrobiaceae bacterium]